MTNVEGDAGGPARQTVLVLQGGGALGAYQAGAYQALADSGILPDWVAGTSIGAINGAIIAGNRPQHRVARLRDFWESVTTTGFFGAETDGPALSVASSVGALQAATFGQPGFFLPRLPPWWMHAPGTHEATSVYDTAPLRATLERLVDFDLLNTQAVRLSAGAVNVRTGELRYFDNHREPLGPSHVMASGALPPGLPAITIAGEQYWDGGIVSNTPLDYVLAEPCTSTLLFQIDLFSAAGPMPRDMGDVEQRLKDITYASRTMRHIEAARQTHNLRTALHRLMQIMPEDERVAALAAEVGKDVCDQEHEIAHIIYHRKNYETQAKDFDFSRSTMEMHWQAGREDTAEALRSSPWQDRGGARHPGMRVHEFRRAVVAGGVA